MRDEALIAIADPPVMPPADFVPGSNEEDWDADRYEEDEEENDMDE
jgi:hypothetical protein